MATVIIFPRKEICGSNKGKDNIEREEHPASFRNLAYICPPSYTLLDLFFFFFCLTLCYFVLVITSLGEERANLRAFLYVCSICACLVLSVSSSSWCLGRAAVCLSCTPWTFLLPFFGRGLQNSKNNPGLGNEILPQTTPEKK